MNRRVAASTIPILFLAAAVAVGADTFTPIRSGPVPDNVPDLWKDYDATAEPLDIEIVKEWEEEGAVVRYVLFTVGIFKGTPSRIAAYYTFPEGLEKGPAFVWCHGGGQRAEKERGLYFARHGYAVLDINWNGRSMEEEITANTNWGKVDPSQGPKFYPGALRKSFKANLDPDEHTIDPVPSPRNSNWFILALTGRRAISFLEQQPEVDPDRLGFTGFSMGGTVTSMVAMDERLKAVVPMVGGTGFVDVDFPGLPGTARVRCPNHPDLYVKTIDGRSYWPHVTCPVLFLNSSNDFHATFERVYQAMARLPHQNWRVTQGLHSSHAPGPGQWILLNQWFDQHLKGADQDIPKTAAADLKVAPSASSATFTTTPDQISRLKSVDIYYSHDPNSRSRFWRSATAFRSGGTWSASLPLRSNLPLFAFANCVYSMDAPVETFRGSTQEFTLTSTEGVYIPPSIDAGALTDGAQPVETLEDFTHGWRDWSRTREGGSLTYKFRDPSVDFAHSKPLAIDVDFPKDKLSFRVRVSKNKYISGLKAPVISYACSERIEQAGRHRIIVRPEDFSAKDEPGMADWANIYSFQLTIYDGSTKSSLDLHGPHKNVIKQIKWVQE